MLLWEPKEDDLTKAEPLLCGAAPWLASPPLQAPGASLSALLLKAQGRGSLGAAGSLLWGGFVGSWSLGAPVLVCGVCGGRQESGSE